MAASAPFALKAGVWFRPGRLLMVSPDSRGTACPLSGRNSTYRPVQISGTGSLFTLPEGNLLSGLALVSTQEEIDMQRSSLGLLAMAALLASTSAYAQGS